MKVLKSHRDNYFHQWNMEDWIDSRQGNSHIIFDFVSVYKMQRGDVMVQSQDAHLLKKLRESMPRDGMFSPLILVATHHKHWKPHLHHFWLSIPFIIYTGNNRYQVARENGYTHISSIVLGTSINFRVFNYLQSELKVPLGQEIEVSKKVLWEK